MTEEAVSAAVSEVQEETSTGDQGKCTRQSAQNAARNVKFLLSPMTTDQFFAGIASERKKTVEINQES